MIRHGPLSVGTFLAFLLPEIQPIGIPRECTSTAPPGCKPQKAAPSLRPLTVQGLTRPTDGQLKHKYMPQLNDTDLDEAATAIRRGMDVYVHREHGRMLIADDPERNVRADPEVFEAIMQDVQSDPDAYVHIERMEATEALDIMKRFTDRVRSQELWQALSYALKRPRPFTTFKAELSRYPKNYEKWREFRQVEYRKYVTTALAGS